MNATPSTPAGATPFDPAVGPRRRVLHLCDVYNGAHGGTEGQLRALVSGLPARFEAELWVIHDSEWLAHNPFPCPTRSLHLRSLKRPSYLRLLPSIAREVRAGRFDLVHTWMVDASVVGPLVGARAGVPVLVSRRDLGYWETDVLRRALRATGRLASGYVANARAVREHVIDAEDAPPSLVRVIRNGHPRTPADAPRDPGLRARLRIPDDAQVVGLVANARPLKRRADLVEAAARLLPRHPRLHLLLVGANADGDVAEPARRLGVLDRVHAVEVEGDVLPLVRETDVCVLCSETEGLSNAVLEYLACGRPVVATDVGGNPDLVEDGENGFLYPPGDVDALARAIGRLLSDPALARRMGEASRSRLEGRFRLERMVSETVAAYEEVVAPAPPRPTIAWETLRDVASLEAIAPEWRAILPRHGFFVSPEWAVPWYAHASRGATPYVLAGRDPSGRLVGVLPLARRRGDLVSCGAGDGADHFDVAAPEAERVAVAASALDHLLGVRWRRLRLSHVAEDAALRLALRARRFAVPFRERRASVAPFVAADGTFEAYLARLSPSRRRALRRPVAGLRADPAFSLVRVGSPEEAPAAVDRVLAFHARRFAAAGRGTAFRGESLRAFHAALAARLAARGELALAFLRLGDRDIAGTYAIRHGGKLYHFQGGFDPAEASRSPGTALLAMLLEEDVFGGGLAEHDLLDGDEAYKVAVATGVRRLYDVEIGRPTTAGRLVALAQGAARWARDEVRARRRSRASNPRTGARGTLAPPARALAPPARAVAPPPSPVAPSPSAREGPR